MRCLIRLVAIFCLAAGLLLFGTAKADSSQDQIRRLRNAGEILSLETLLAQHHRQYPNGGVLLEAKLELENSHYLYDLKFLSTDGVVQEFEYDARTGELWHLESKPQD